MAQVYSHSGKRAAEASAGPRKLLRSKVAKLSEAECGEVIEYIEVMRSLRREASDRIVVVKGGACVEEDTFEELHWRGRASSSASNRYRDNRSGGHLLCAKAR